MAWAWASEKPRRGVERGTLVLICGNKGGLVTPPAALAHASLQLVQTSDGGADAAAGELTVLAVTDVGNPVVVGDGAELAQLAPIALLLDPADGGDSAGLVGAEGAIAENRLVGRSRQLGLVAAGAGLENGVEGVGHLLDQRASRHGRSPPGGA